MESAKRRYILLALIICLVAGLIWTGLLGTSPAQAQQQSTLAQKELLSFPRFDVIVVFPDPSPVDVFDLGGNDVGEGTHQGRVLCIGENCNQKTHLNIASTNYVYNFRTRQAFDPLSETLVVAGTGSFDNNGQKERFSFTVTFQNNKDGTVTARYVASRPDASFIIRSPGVFEFVSR